MEQTKCLIVIVNISAMISWNCNKAPDLVICTLYVYWSAFWNKCLFYIVFAVHAWCVLYWYIVSVFCDWFYTFVTLSVTNILHTFCYCSVCQHSQVLTVCRNLLSVSIKTTSLQIYRSLCLRMIFQVTKIRTNHGVILSN